MKDFIVGNLLYFPPFMLVLLCGVAAWLVVRPAYMKKIYGGFFWHPGLIDLGGLSVCVYITHLLLA